MSVRSGPKNWSKTVTNGKNASNTAVRSMSNRLKHDPKIVFPKLPANNCMVKFTL